MFSYVVAQVQKLLSVSLSHLSHLPKQWLYRCIIFWHGLNTFISPPAGCSHVSVEIHRALLTLVCVEILRWISIDVVQLFVVSSNVCSIVYFSTNSFFGEFVHSVLLVFQAKMLKHLCLRIVVDWSFVWVTSTYICC